MYAVFCGVHILVLVGVMVLFILCVRKTTSPAKISFMLVTFSLFILILGMYLELVSSNTTMEAIMALKMQYIGMYPFSLSLLYFTSCMGGFHVPKWLWTIMAVLDAASFTAIVSTGTTTVNTVGPADWQTLKKPALGDNYILSKKNTDSPAQNVFVLGNADAVGDVNDVVAHIEVGEVFDVPALLLLWRAGAADAGLGMADDGQF